MSKPELPELFLDDGEMASEESLPELRLRGRYLEEHLTPIKRLSRLMLWSACSLRLRRDIDMCRTVVVIIEAPSKDWADPIQEAARALFKQASFVSNDKEGKSAEPTVGDLDLRLAMTARMSLIITSSRGLNGVGSAILASVDHHVTVLPPSSGQIGATIRATFGNRSIKGIPKHVGENAPASALIAAIRPKENAARAIARLMELNRLFSTPSTAQAIAGPTLHDLHGYGAAKEWGLELAEDLTAFKRGEIQWSEIASAAVLHGAPGTGKTYFAGALARTCQIPMIATNLGAMFNAGNGYLHSIIRQISDAFQEARSQRPSLLFIDELDSLPDRQTLDQRHQDYWTTVVNHFLKQLDDNREGVVVLGATNMLDRIDRAILRPGRLERQFEIALPGEAALAGMLRHHLGQRLLGIDLQPIARLAIGATGAGVALHIKSASARARRDGRSLVVEDLLAEFGSDESPKLLRRISVHEAGHAIVAFHLGRQVEHLSNRRNSASGAGVLFAALEDGATRPLLEEETVILLAGRAAEMLVLGEASTGATADLSRATKLTAAIHGSFALGNSLVYFADPLMDTRLLSDPAFRDLIEAELRVLEARAHVILTSQMEQLDAVATALQENRVLSGADFLKLVRQ